MPYSISLSRKAAKQLASIPRAHQQRIVAAIDALQANARPRAAVKITGTQNHYRLRVGTYRVLYEIHDVHLLILVFRVAHRREAYR
jgi:mRNA interferase RelE/StbE